MQRIQLVDLLGPEVSLVGLALAVPNYPPAQTAQNDFAENLRNILQYVIRVIRKIQNVKTNTKKLMEKSER